MSRYQIALGTYWLLFIITPVFLIAMFLNPTWAIGVFFMAIIIGERAFRLWKKIWKVE